VPLVASAPFQAPDAVQLLALADDQVIVVELPRAIDDDARDSVGATGDAVTANVALLAGDAPSAFAQVSE
jgi:hypothetical protein